jgi:GAF domain-containing protein
MDTERKIDRYRRLCEQLQTHLAKTGDPTARMATVVALLHHKLSHFVWTGFYLLRNGELTVGPYQGTLACLVLKPAHSGVCWAGFDRGESVVVPDVQAFPGHIACDSRTRSEIVVPLRDRDGRVVGVLDVDSDRPAAFDDADRAGLEQIVGLIFA